MFLVLFGQLFMTLFTQPWMRRMIEKLEFIHLQSFLDQIK